MSQESSWVGHNRPWPAVRLNPNRALRPCRVDALSRGRRPVRVRWPQLAAGASAGFRVLRAVGALRAVALGLAAADTFRFGAFAVPVVAGAVAAIKNSSIDLPAASAARSQSGRLPMPPQVLPAPSAYFGGGEALEALASFVAATLPLPRLAAVALPNNCSAVRP